MVITGLTRNQFVLTHTRVRIPLSPPKKQEASSIEGASLHISEYEVDIWNLKEDAVGAT